MKRFGYICYLFAAINLMLIGCCTVQEQRLPWQTEETKSAFLSRLEQEIKNAILEAQKEEGWRRDLYLRWTSPNKIIERKLIDINTLGELCINPPGKEWDVYTASPEDFNKLLEEIEFNLKVLDLVPGGMEISCFLMWKERTKRMKLRDLYLRIASISPEYKARAYSILWGWAVSEPDDPVLKDLLIQIFDDKDPQERYSTSVSVAINYDIDLPVEMMKRVFKNVPDWKIARWLYKRKAISEDTVRQVVSEEIKRRVESVSKEVSEGYIEEDDIPFLINFELIRFGYEIDVKDAKELYLQLEEYYIKHIEKEFEPSISFEFILRRANKGDRFSLSILKKTIDLWDEYMWQCLLIDMPPSAIGSVLIRNDMEVGIIPLIYSYTDSLYPSEGGLRCYWNDAPTLHYEKSSKPFQIQYWEYLLRVFDWLRKKEWKSQETAERIKRHLAICEKAVKMWLSLPRNIKK